MGSQVGYDKYLNLASWEVKIPKVVQQPNGSDCGVLLCQFLKQLWWKERIPQWQPIDYPALRQMTAWETLEKRVRV
jgi:Ulp1 family protease